MIKEKNTYLVTMKSDETKIEQHYTIVATGIVPAIERAIKLHFMHYRGKYFYYPAKAEILD